MVLESEFGDLDEIQFDRRRPSKDAHQDFNLALFGVDFFNRAVEICEGPVDDPYLVSGFEKVFRLRF